MARTYRYVVCAGNRGNPAALEMRKIYRVIPGVSAESRSLVRVIDGSGEDYLCFWQLQLAPFTSLSETHPREPFVERRPFFAHSVAAPWSCGSGYHGSRLRA